MLQKLSKGNYLSAEDIDAHGAEVTITSEPELVHNPKFDNDRYEVDVEFSDGEKRRWSMNPTTSDFLIGKLGQKEKDWPGKKVELETNKTKIDGTVHRVVYAKGAQEA